MRIGLNLLYLMILPALVLFTGCRNTARLIAGGYNPKGENGINIYDFSLKKGELNLVASADAGPNPSYFCISEKYKTIYSINEVSDFKGTNSGGVTSLKYEGNFENIRKVHELPVPNGGPCFISLTPGNDFLLIANYGGGSVAVVKLDENGIPDKISDTIIYNGIGNEVSRAHMIASDPAGERIYVTDLGLDRIMIYKLDKTTGRLYPFNENGVALPDGTGPRHFVFSGTGSMMYVIGEKSSTVSAFAVDDTAGLRFVQTISTVREGFEGVNYCADLHFGKSGKFLYGSNRGENSIVAFAVSQNGGLSLKGHTDCGGNWPRNFVIDPSGKFILVANQKSGNISVLKIDDRTGIPSEMNHQASHKAPSCLKFSN